MQKKKIKNNTDAVLNTTDILWSLASTLEPVLRGWRDAAAYERHKEYEAYRKRKRELKKDYAKKKKIKSKEYKKYDSAIRSLLRSEYVTQVSNKKELKLTEKGWVHLAATANGFAENKGRSNTLYIIIFDVPEKHRRIRDIFRRCLYNIGFELLQKSIFITKSKRSFDFVQTIVSKSEIRDYIKYIEAKKVY